MRFRVDAAVFDLGACWVLAKVVIAFPVLRWSDWSGHKTSATVRTDII